MRCIDWVDGAVVLIDQTLLPGEERWLRITDPDELVDAIRRLAVRGAPALGAAGALGVALAAAAGSPTVVFGAAGSAAVGSGAAGSAAVGSGAAGSAAVGSGAAGSAAVGSGAAGSAAVGSGAAGSAAVGSGAAGSAAVGSGAATAGDHVAGSPAAAGDPGAGSVAAPDRFAAVEAAAARIRAARPTAVNLARGVDRALARLADGPAAVLAEARQVLAEEASASRAIGERGADLLGGDTPLRLLTHCNTGWLATVEWGTALGIVTVLHERGQVERVYADETRPLLQGARLTAYELAALGIEHRVIADGAAASVIARGLVDAVVVGADRIAANGDVANKVGTYPLALAAARAGIPFIVAAPESTVDSATPTGAGIEIEERDPGEVFAGPAYNPAFDVTPADLVTAVVTEARTVRPAQGESL